MLLLHATRMLLLRVLTIIVVVVVAKAVVMIGHATGIVVVHRARPAIHHCAPGSSGPPHSHVGVGHAVLPHLELLQVGDDVRVLLQEFAHVLALLFHLGQLLDHLVKARSGLIGTHGTNIASSHSRTSHGSTPKAVVYRLPLLGRRQSLGEDATAHIWWRRVGGSLLLLVDVLILDHLVLHLKGVGGVAEIDVAPVVVVVQFLGL